MDDGGFICNPWNFVTVYVEPYFDSQILSHASGFFWAHGSRKFLVTNWHVLSGRNPLDGKPMHKKAGIPNSLKFYSYRRRRVPSTEEGNFKVDYVPVLVPLDDPSTGTARWLEHPSYGRRVDVAALDITDVVADLHHDCANSLDGDKPKHLDAGQDVFILGFPFGHTPGAPAPVWKRGSIALDPTRGGSVFPDTKRV